MRKLYACFILFIVSSPITKSLAQLRVLSDGSVLGPVLTTDSIRNSGPVFSERLGVASPGSALRSPLAVGCAGDDSSVVYVKGTASGTRSRLYGMRVRSSAAGHPFFALDVNASTFGAAVGVQSVASSSVNAAIPAEYRERMLPCVAVGVRGWAVSGEKRLALGVSGVALASDGCGVYGGTEEKESVLPGRYAGFFNGDTRVVNGAITGTHMVPNDAALMDDVRPVSADEMENRLSGLSAVSYSPKRQAFSPYRLGTHGESYTMNDSTEAEGRKYGFSNPELFPELLRESPDGYVCMDYAGLVPALTVAVQEQRTVIRSLRDSLAVMAGDYERLEDLVIRLAETVAAAQSELESMKREVYPASALDKSDAPRLSPGVPNPFSDQTRVDLYLPESVKSAGLFVYGLSGELQRSYAIPARGDVSVTVDGMSLSAGRYVCTLVADGSVAGSEFLVVER